MLTHASIKILALAAFAAGCASEPTPQIAALSGEAKAVEFLKREVPAWSRDNGCFSCHNNGDAARALHAAARHGYRVPPLALADTTAWVTHPERWEHNQGDPGFSDQRLADLQFASALAVSSPVSAAHKEQKQIAAFKIVKAQAADGSWPIDAANPVGSPTTYGTTLATYLAWTLLRDVADAEVVAAVRRAETKLASVAADCVPNAAVRLLFASERGTAVDAMALDFLRRAQTGDGGWGPYADSPPEAYDTALALLALAKFRDGAGVKTMIGRGRDYLFQTQMADGSWPATTRPSGGQSYAQQMSTTGWATLALLETR